MITLTAQGKVYAGVLVVGIAIGMGGGWALWRPRPAPVETPAPSIRQPDSSLVVARRPDSTVRPSHIIPKGATPEREIHLAIEPKPLIVHDTVTLPAPAVGPAETITKVDTVQPPPVRMAITDVRVKDGSHRIIASSPDGRVLDSLSIDVPLVNMRPQRVLAWSVGVTRDLLTASWGGVVTRDLGPLRTFAIATPAQAGLKAELRAGVALRF